MSGKDLTAIALIIAASCFLLGTRTATLHYQAQAIEHGCAEYDKTIGDWQWKGE